MTAPHERKCRESHERKCGDSRERKCGDSRPRLSSRAQLDRSPNHEPFSCSPIDPRPARPRP